MVESRVQVEPIPWLRGPARVVAFGQRLMLDQSGAEEYSPDTVPDIAIDLANVQNPADACAYIAKHGLLWHGSKDGPLVEDFADWIRETTTLRGVLSSVIALRRAEQGDRAALGALKWEPEELARLVGFCISSDDDVLRANRIGIATLITMGLQGSQQCLVALSGRNDGRFERRTLATNLLHYAYDELAYSLEHRTPASQCEGCNGFFVHADPRRRYCSDTCAGRSRQRRHRARRDESKR